MLPDTSFDTLNYHLYLQERPFSNNVSFNFFPARWINTFSLPLADRFLCFFRLVFGYRFGIMGNLIVMFLMYYQVKIILSVFVKNKYYISLISVAVLFTEQILYNMATYYVDLISIPLFLEIIIFLLKDKEKKISNKENFSILLIAGLLVSLKISNAFLLIPLAIIYIYRYKKSFNYKTFLFGILIFIFPMAVYLLNNYLQTSNPIFPFYNSIFKSNYLPNENWIEGFYGPKTVMERLFWPLYLFEFPRRAFDTDVYYNRIGFGFIVSLFIIVCALIERIFKREENKNSFVSLSILYIVFCLLWGNFMMGYIRYALVLEVISGIIMAIFVYNYFNDERILFFLISSIMIFGFFYTTEATLSDVLFGYDKISWRKSYYVDEENYELNKTHLFDKYNYDEYIKDIDCFGIVDYNSGYAALLSKNKKIVNLNEGYNTDYGKEEFDKIVDNCKNIYTISTSTTMDRTSNYLKDVGYEKKGNEIVFKTSFINYKDDIILYEIERSDYE